MLLLLAAALAASPALDAAVGIELDGPGGTDGLKQRLQQKVAAIKALEAEASRAVAEGTTPASLEARAELGRAWEDLAGSLLRVQPPTPLDPHQEAFFRAALLEQALPFCELARETWTLTRLDAERALLPPPAIALEGLAHLDLDQPEPGGLNALRAALASPPPPKPPPDDEPPKVGLLGALGAPGDTVGVLAGPDVVIAAAPSPAPPRPPMAQRLDDPRLRACYVARNW